MEKRQESPDFFLFFTCLKNSICRSRFEASAFVLYVPNFLPVVSESTTYLLPIFLIIFFYTACAATKFESVVARLILVMLFFQKKCIQNLKGYTLG